MHNTPLKFFRMKISADERDCLVIEMPRVNQPLHTNDVVKLVDPKSISQVLGRYDNIINSGGVKLMPEAIEQKIQGVLTCLFVAGVADERLGQKLVLVVEAHLPLTCGKPSRRFQHTDAERDSSNPSIQRTETQKINRIKPLEKALKAVRKLFRICLIRLFLHPTIIIWISTHGTHFEKRKHKMFAGSTRWRKPSRIGKDIAIAVKQGGPNPDNNPKLRMATRMRKVWTCRKTALKMRSKAYLLKKKKRLPGSCVRRICTSWRTRNWWWLPLIIQPYRGEHPPALLKRWWQHG